MRYILKPFKDCITLLLIYLRNITWLGTLYSLDVEPLMLILIYVSSHDQNKTQPLLHNPSIHDWFLFGCQTKSCWVAIWDPYDTIFKAWQVSLEGEKSKYTFMRFRTKILGQLHITTSNMPTPPTSGTSGSVKRHADQKVQKPRMKRRV